MSIETKPVDPTRKQNPSWEECHCVHEYSIEPHGNGWALYFGRCNHMHGLNLAFITEPDMPRIQQMILKLNSL